MLALDGSWLAVDQPSLTFAPGFRLPQRRQVCSQDTFGPQSIGIGSRLGFRERIGGRTGMGCFEAGNCSFERLAIGCGTE
jgi:hypothetical protein